MCEAVPSTVSFGDGRAVRLYDGVWVNLDGGGEPVQAFRDKRNAGLFHIEGFQYDVDGRPAGATTSAPKILSLLSLEAARAAGLDTRHNGEFR